MSQTVAEILSSLDDLSQEERAELACAFVCSLEPGEEAGTAEAWQSELSRRVAEIRAGKAVGKPADRLFDELRA